MKKAQSGTLGDFLSLAETALSALLGAQKEVGSALSGKREAIVRKLDLVTREEFDVAFAMIKKIRAAQGDLDSRLAGIEKKLNLSRPQKAPAKKQKRTKS